MSTTIITSLIWVFNLFAPKIADKIIDWTLSKKGIYIDRISLSRKDNSIIIDITSSSSLDQEVSITRFSATISKPSNAVGMNGVKEISSEYRVYGENGMNVTEVNQEKLSEKAKVWDAGNHLHLGLPLAENQPPKSTNRFIIEWFTSENLKAYETILVVLDFSYLGKKKATKITKFSNPLWEDNKKSKHKIYSVN
jgi:hypothetical protein